MLTARENMKETLAGGNPDRFVNQYEALSLQINPTFMTSPFPEPGAPSAPNGWGVYYSWPEGSPGGMPDHAPDKIVIKDIENWKDYVKGPSLDFPQELWDTCKGMMDSVDRSKAYAGAFIAPGLFEQCHHLSEIKNALMYFITNSKEMHELIKYFKEWELELAEGICTNLKPDALFHHDDWGSEINSFMRPEQFAEFFVEPYKELYGYYKSHGCEIVVHHCDSYAANLVPYMIEMGIDVWQGAMEKNDVPALIKQFGGQISFMGGINNASVEFDGWTEEHVRGYVRKTLEMYDPNYFIPCITQGGPGSCYPGVYEVMTDEIDKINIERFGITDPDAMRMPPTTMF